jgi:hypothetical protein
VQHHRRQRRGVAPDLVGDPGAVQRSKPFHVGED